MSKIVKNVFITGGTTGIGLALAKEYLDQGHRVAVFARNQQKWNESNLSKNTFAHFYIGDVSSFEKTEMAMKDFASKYKGLDLVIANAGIGNPNKDPIPDFNLSRKIFEINVQGLINSTEAAFKIMFQQKNGHLVFISSIAAYSGLSGNGAYCASKAAVMRMAETYAIDWKPFGIDVSCVFPGFVDTPLTQANHHGMPFLMSANKAAKIIFNNVEKKKLWIGFPWQTYGFMAFLSLLPRSLYIQLARKMKLSFYVEKE